MVSPFPQHGGRDQNKKCCNTNKYFRRPVIFANDPILRSNTDFISLNYDTTPLVAACIYTLCNVARADIT